MYRFEHRQLKKHGLRPRSAKEIREIAAKFEALNVADSTALIRTLFLEADWVEDPNVIYFRQEFVEPFIQLGRETDDVYPSVPITCALNFDRSGLLYSIKDDRIEIAQDHLTGRYFYIFHPDSDDLSTLSEPVQRAVCLIRGLSVYASNFPQQLKSGFPSRSINQRANLIKGQKNQYLAKQVDASGTFVRRPHFRTLQHERFSRNTDGSPKVILIPAAEVKLVKNQESQHVK